MLRKVVCNVLKVTKSLGVYTICYDHAVVTIAARLIARQNF